MISKSYLWLRTLWMFTFIKLLVCLLDFVADIVLIADRLKNLCTRWNERRKISKWKKKESSFSTSDRINGNKSKNGWMDDLLTVFTIIIIAIVFRMLWHWLSVLYIYRYQSISLPSLVTVYCTACFLNFRLFASFPFYFARKESPYDKI
jgi:hypothetical protein